VTTQAITLINNNTPSWIFDSWAGATGTQYGFILRLNQAPTYAFAVTEAPVGNAGMRLDPDGKLWIAKGSPAYDWSGGLHEVPVLDIAETWTAGQIFEKDIQIGTGSETDDSSIFFTTDSHSEKFHWDYANARFELSDDLWVNGNLSFNAVTDTVAGIQNQNLRHRCWDSEPEPHRQNCRRGCDRLVDDGSGELASDDQRPILRQFMPIGVCGRLRGHESTCR
jgi:hypothetical protein